MIEINRDDHARLVQAIREGRLTTGQRERLVDLVYAASSAARYGPVDASIRGTGQPFYQARVVAAYTALIQVSGGGVDG